MIRRSYIRNKAKTESYKRDRVENKKWSELKGSRFLWLWVAQDGFIRDLDGNIFTNVKNSKDLEVSINWQELD